MTRPLLSAIAFFALATGAACAAPPAVATTRAVLPPAPPDAWDQEVERISRIHVANEGIDPVIAGYTKLLERFPNDPRRAEVMYQIAATYSGIAIPKLGIEQDPAKGLEWLKKADAAGVPGSAIWNKTHFELAMWLPAADAKESRRLLDEIAAKANGNSLVLARVEFSRQLICINRQEWDAAIAHCVTILQWYNDERRIPQDWKEKNALDGLLYNSAEIMLDRIQTFSAGAERDARLKTLSDGNWFFVGQIQWKKAVLPPATDFSGFPILPN